ncbi:hypothetical protein MJO47_05375 [Desulfuromonas sp. KJ2020]|uniref:hypothetical protein n=1 Tax=Desulfuromonas sp. KJ2020 TaxID=2919173 RepID=UPI0020A7AEC6|nr:hypothetical protein [Desulfuromonas sp. KJ2020]MCP3176527.1 hypothetical protein [Desulfuromonas sp. KJ2020]
MSKIIVATTWLIFSLVGISGAEVIGEIDSARGFFSIGVMYLDDDAPQISEKWVEPEITSEIRSDYPNGNASVIIITKIRDDLPKDDSILERVKNKNIPLQKMHGDKRVSITEKKSSNSKVLQVVFKEITYDEFTPYGLGFTKSESIGVSQYIVKKGFLVEFFTFIKNNSKTPFTEIEPVIIELCDEFRDSFKIEI